MTRHSISNGFTYVHVCPYSLQCDKGLTDHIYIENRNKYGAQLNILGKGRRYLYFTSRLVARVNRSAAERHIVRSHVPWYF